MDSTRLAIAARIAATQGGVVSRTQLYAAGLREIHIRRAIESGRWAKHGRQTIAVHTAPIIGPALWWRAVWEVGTDIAALDGVSALLAAGLTGFRERNVHVSALHHHNVRAPVGVVVHKIIRRVDGELPTNGPPRVTPAVAAIRSAHWAATDRQAALLLVLPVQQGLVSAQSLQDAERQIRGRNRRDMIRRLVADITDGARSLGELDFAVMCRRHGLPEPSRQVLRRGPKGRIYLDVYWECCGLAIEIDGSGHQQGLAVTADNLRQNSVILAGDRLLRIDLVGLRLESERFMAQVATAHSCHRAA